MKPYLIPAKEARASVEIHKSKFISTAGPAFSVEQAREFIERIRAEFPDASHNVPIFLIGKVPSLIEHCSDDGEPSGTAGRPALAILKGSGLADVVVVITRYFGGIKLGTGGLVRAYSDAVREVLKVLPRAQKITTQVLKFSLGYGLYERVRLIIQRLSGMIEREEFAAEVTLSARFPIERVPQFQSELMNLTNGNVQIEIAQTDRNTIIPTTD